MAKKNRTEKHKQKPGPSLSEAIAVLRAELAQAKSEKTDGDPVLVVEEAELELSLGLTYDVKGNTGVNWWVYQAGVEGTRTRQRTHTLRVKLKPLDDEDNAWQVRRKIKSKNTDAEDKSN